MTVSAIFKGNKDSLGRKSVYIRVNDGSKRTFRATTMKLLPSQLKKSIVVNHPQAKQFNSLVREWIIEAENKILFKDQFEDVNFFTYCTECLRAWDKVKRPETLRQHLSEINKIKNFAGVHLKLSQITPEFLYRYKSHLYEKGNSTNTLWKTFKFLRLIVLKAFKEKRIRENSFQMFEMPKYKDPKKVYLSKSQIDKIDKFSLDKKCPNEMKLAAVWFVITAYTGLRYGDAFAFSKSNIVNGRIVVYTSKTHEVVGMPLNSKLKALFERIDYKPLHYSNAHYNRLLKGIAVMCGIEEKLTGHVARHTAAMIWANAGLSQEVVSKLLGHNSLKTTAIYFKISNQRIDQELKKVKY
jgi:site-specific recombinase XerD